MKRCDPRARAKCPEGETCELYADFADGSWCDDFNDNVLNRPMTNADRIRAMSDEEKKDSILAVHLGYSPWCDHHCENEGDDGCDRCIGNWLQQPAEEVPDNG